MLALSKVMGELAKSCRLNVSQLKFGDKEPTWDGDIYVNDTPSPKNTGRLIKIPVQIKGSTKGLNKNGTFTYSIAKKHLLNFKNDNGAMFIVATINKANMQTDRIYYAALDVVTLNKILSSNTNKGYTAKIAVAFNVMPTEIEQIEQVFDNFSRLRKSLEGFDRMKITHTDLPDKELKSIQFMPTGDAIFAKNISDLEGKSVVGIYNYEDGDCRIIDEPIKIIKAYATPQILKKRISIDGVTYFNEVTINDSKDKREVAFGKCISFIYPRRSDTTSLYTVSIKIKFNNGELFDERLAATRFLINAIEKGGYEINGVNKNMFKKDNEPKPLLDKLKDDIVMLEKAECLFSLLKIPLNIDLSKLSEKDHKKINTLIDLLIYEKTSNYSDGDAIFFCEVIGEFKFALQRNYSAGKKGYQQIVPFPSKTNKPSIQMRHKNSTEKDGHIVPCYKIIPPEEIAQLTNLDYADIYNDYINMPETNPYKHSLIEELCLALINSYDQGDMRKEEALALAQKFIEWEISTYGENTSAIISLFQVYKRTRSLTTAERNKLLDIADSEYSNETKAVVYLLLDNQEMAEHYSNKI